MGSKFWYVGIGSSIMYSAQYIAHAATLIANNANFLTTKIEVITPPSIVLAIIILGLCIALEFSAEFFKSG